MNDQRHRLILRSGIAAVVFCIAGWLGYQANSIAVGKANDYAGNVNSMSAASGSAGPKGTDLRGPRRGLHHQRGSSAKESSEARALRVAALKQKIKGLWMAAPENSINWELQNETHRLLAGLEPDELSAFFLELPPSGLSSYLFLRFEVAKAWALKDGPGAVMGCGVGHRIDFLCRIRAMGAWGAKDPNGALAWLRSAEMPAEPNGLRRSLRTNLLEDLAESNLGLVMEELGRLDPEERQALVPDLAAVASKGNPEQLQKLLEMAREATPEGKMSDAEERLLRQTARTDPEAALRQIEASSQLDAPERKRLDLAVLDAQAERAPVAALEQWLARNPGMEAIPEDARRAVASALNEEEKEFSAWLEGMPAGNLRDDFYELSIRALAERRRFDEALRFSGGISDPAIRADSLRALHSFWKTADPSGAAKWLQTLPTAERDLLGN